MDIITLQVGYFRRGIFTPIGIYMPNGDCGTQLEFILFEHLLG
jgi:hypothetical protein